MVLPKPDIEGVMKNWMKNKMVSEKVKEKKIKKPKSEIEDNVELLLD